MRIVAIVGRSGSGKTTLLRGLIPVLVARGLRVGAVKHSHHPIADFDKPGSDSQLLSRSGALITVLSGPGWGRVVAGPTAGKSLGTGTWDELIEALRAEKLDVALFEGGKGSPFAKLEVVRGQAPLLAPGGNVRAIVGDAAVDGLPLFAPDDLRAIADLVLGVGQAGG